MKRRNVSLYKVKNFLISITNTPNNRITYMSYGKFLLSIKKKAYKKDNQHQQQKAHDVK